MAKISEHDLPLVRAFLEREARDFERLRDNDHQREQWIDFRLMKIEEVLKNQNPDRIGITCIGNTGVVFRQLWVDPDKANLGGENAMITLCNCGKNSCWGDLIMSKDLKPA